MQQFPTFSPEAAACSAIWLIIGQRDAEKSVLLHDLLYCLRFQFEHNLQVPSSRPQFTCRSLSNVSWETTTVFHHLLNREIQPPLRSSLVAEGLIMSQASHELDDLFGDCRYLNVSVFVPIYDIKCLSSKRRMNADYVFCFRPNSKNMAKQLYIEYFGKQFDTFEAFWQVILQCEMYQCLVLDRIQQKLFLYKASPTLPPFVLHTYCPDRHTCETYAERRCLLQQHLLTDIVDIILNMLHPGTHSCCARAI